MWSLWIFSQLMLIGIFHAGDAILCGTPVSSLQRHRFSYLVHIIHFDNEDIGFCVGAIIDATHILTAAHCLFDPIDGETVISAGVLNLRSSLRTERKVSKIHVHKNYKKFGAVCKRSDQLRKWVSTVCQCMKRASEEECDVENDIAVLTLSEGLPLGDYIKLVNLPDTDFLPRCDVCDYAGWGVTGDDGPISLDLMSIPMMILTPQDCTALDARLSSNQFCAMDPIEEACPLEGDSGAPVVFNNTIYGVSSTGRKHPNYPNVFEKVFDHLDFIRKALED